MDTNNQQEGLGLSKKQQRRLEKQRAKAARHAGQMVKSSSSRIVFWLIVIAIIGLFVYIIGKLATSTPNVTDITTDISITSTDHALGNPNAEIQLIEYADFQCPGCAAFHPIVKQIISEYEDKIAYAYRHYPLPQHQHAEIMAQAAEAAGAQGKFWEMHDLIFTNQRSWSSLINVNKVISDYAVQLNLATDQFETDIDARTAKDRVENDRLSGIGYGVNSTPTFFLNGKKISLPRSLEEFKTILDTAILTANEPTPAVQ